MLRVLAGVANSVLGRRVWILGRAKGHLRFYASSLAEAKLGVVAAAMTACPVAIFAMGDDAALTGSMGLDGAVGIYVAMISQSAIVRLAISSG